MTYLKLLSLISWMKYEKVSLKRDTCFVLRTAEEVVPFIQECRNTLVGEVLFFYDNDAFHSQLKTCIVAKELVSGYTVIDGPNAALFGQDHVTLIIDYTAIPSEKLSSLNELFDKPPRFLGRCLGPNVKIASVISSDLAIFGLLPDCNSRLTYIDQTPSQLLLKPSCVIENIRNIPEHACVIECHDAKDLRSLLFGSPCLGKDGGLEFHYSDWIEALRQQPRSQTLVLKNAPLEDKGLRDFLSQIYHGLTHITVNGQDVSLPQSLRILTYTGYTQEEQSFLETYLSQPASNPDLFVLVNNTTFEQCFSSVYPHPDTGQLIQTKGILELLKDTGGTIKISGTVSESRLYTLRFAVANHNKCAPTCQIKIQHVQQQRHHNQAQALLESGTDIYKLTHSIRQAYFDEPDENYIVIDIGLTTQPEDLIQHWRVDSFDQQRYTALNSQLKLALDAGRRVLIRGLDHNPNCLSHLETLFEEPPYLLVNGKKYDYQSDQIAAVFKTIPPLLEKKMDKPFIFEISDYKAHFEPLFPALMAKNPDVFEKLLDLSTSLAPYLKSLGYDSIIHFSILDTLFTVASKKGMSQALIEVIATRFRSNDAKFLVVKKEIESYFPAGLRIEPPYQPISELKLSSLLSAVCTFPIVLIQGAPGSSKTYFAEHVPLLLNGHTDTALWSISVGPDADPDILIGKQERVRDQLTFRDGPIMKWAKHLPADSTTYPTLVINEANLAPEGFWAILNGLKENPPCLDIGPKKLILTQRHRVILTQNPASMVGRNLHADLAAMAYPLYFPEEDPSELIESLVRPLLNKRGLEEKIEQDRAIRDIMNQMQNPISIRDCLDVTESIAKLLTQKDTPDFASVFRQLKARDTTFDFNNSSTFQLVGAIWIRLTLALGTPEFVGKRGMLIEGPPGRGKDATLDRVLDLYTDDSTRIRRVTCKVGADYFEMADMIRDAKTAGQILIISELNLLPSSIVEGLLNDALTGKAKEGFFLFLTANSGRHVFSDAFKNRLHCHTLSDYSKEDLFSLVIKKISARVHSSTAHGYAQSLIDFHFKLHQTLSAKGLAIKPTSRELLATIDELATHGSWDDLVEVLGHTYGLFLIRLNLSTFKPWFMAKSQVQEVLSSDFLLTLSDFEKPLESPEQPTPEEPITSTHPISSTREASPIANITPPETLLEQETLDLKAAHYLPIPVQNQFAPLQSKPIDFSGIDTQTQEDIDKQSTYFQYHPEVSEHQYAKREYRLYAYDHITENCRIGQCTTHSFSDLHPEFYRPGHAFEILTSEYVIGDNIPIPASDSIVRAPIPSLSRDERLVGYSTSDGQPLTFFSESHTGFIYVQLPQTPTTLTYLLSIDKRSPYQYVDYFEDLKEPSYSRRDVSLFALPPSLKALLDALPLGLILGITPQDSFSDRLSKVVHYCGRFTEGIIPETYHKQLQNALAQNAALDQEDSCKFANLILQKSGVCRHRSWAFLALARYFNIQAQLAGNAIHNLVEVRVQNHKGDSVWIKVELAQHGFRSQNPNVTSIDKETVGKIKEAFQLQRLINSGQYPIPNIATAETLGIKPLEILIQSTQHLRPKTRNVEFNRFCSHMNQLQCLNPADLLFHIPDDCTDSWIEIIKMAVPTWSDFSLETSRNYVNDTISFLVYSSHKLHDFPALQGPIRTFFNALLTATWDSEQAGALMDKLFTMKQPHKNHLNKFLFSKNAFDYFKESTHRKLFSEKVSTSLFQKILIDERALLCVSDIETLRGEYLTYQIGRSKSEAENIFQRILRQPPPPTSVSDEIRFSGYPNLKDLVQAQRGIIEKFQNYRQDIHTKDLERLALSGVSKDVFSEFIKPLTKVHEQTKQMGSDFGPDFEGFNPELIHTYTFILSSESLDLHQKSQLLKPLFFNFFKITIPFYRTLEYSRDDTLQKSETKWGFIAEKPYSYFSRHLGLLVLKNPEVFDLNPDSEFIPFLKNIGHSLFTQTVHASRLPHTFLPEIAEDWETIRLEIQENIERTVHQLYKRACEKPYDDEPLTFEESVHHICRSPITFCNENRSNCLTYLFFKKVFIQSIEQLREYEQSLIPQLFLTFRYAPKQSQILIQSYSACLGRFGVQTALEPNVLKWVDEAMACILGTSRIYPNKLQNVPNKGWNSPFAQTIWLKALDRENTLFEQYQLQELLAAPLSMPEGDLKQGYTTILSRLFETSSDNNALLIWLNSILQEGTSALAIRQAYKPILDTYFDTLLSRPLVYEHTEPFDEETINLQDTAHLLRGALNQNTADRLLKPTSAIVSQSYSFTPSPSIDPMRLATRQSFFKSPEFTTSQKTIVINGMLLFDERYSMDKQFAFFTSLWQLSNHNVIFATFKGSAKPKNFREFSILVKGFLESSDSDPLSPPPIPEYICKERYPNAIVLGNREGPRYQRRRYQVPL